jgi:hypothetical protein
VATARRHGRSAAIEVGLGFVVMMCRSERRRSARRQGAGGDA